MFTNSKKIHTYLRIFIFIHFIHTSHSFVIAIAIAIAITKDIINKIFIAYMYVLCMCILLNRTLGEIDQIFNYDLITKVCYMFSTRMHYIAQFHNWILV